MATQNAVDSQDPIQVALGATGVANPTNHSVLVGAGTSAITQLTVGNSGNVLIAATTADPAFAALTSTLGSIAYTNGAGSLAINIANYADKISWTPILTFGGASVGITYDTQTAFYSQIANLVFIAGTIILTSKGSSTGNALITNLPVTSVAAPPAFDVSMYMQNINTVVDPGIFLTKTANTTVMSLNRQQAGSGSAIGTITDTSFTNTTQINFSGIYLA